MRQISIKRILVIIAIFCCSYQNSFSQVYTVGTGTGSNASSTFPGTYNNYWGYARHQFLVKASELTAAGASAGVIKNLAFNVLAPNSTNNTLSGLTISIGQTSLNTLTAFVATGLTTVYSSAYAPVTGWNTHNFNTCFTWDGTSNILVEVCFTGTTSTAGAQTYWTTGLGFNASLYTYNGGCGTTSGLTTSTNRPNMRFYILPNKVDGYVSKVTSPTSSIINLGTSFTPAVVLANNACTGTITTANIGYSWNGGTPVNVAWTGSIAPGATSPYTFTGSVTANVAGANTLKTWMTNSNGLNPDANAANDTLTYLVYVVDNTVYDPLGYSGKSFWLAFMQNYDNAAASLQLRVNIATGGQPANITISAPRLSATPITTLTVPANTVQSYTIPNTIASTVMSTAGSTTETISNTGISIQSDQNVSVYGLSYYLASTDGFLAIPETGLGKQYLAIGQVGIVNTAAGAVGIDAPSEYIVVATQNNTTLTITNKAASSGHAAGATWTVPNMMAGQTYLVQGKVSGVATTKTSTDLTGTLINADKPVAVFGGSQCAEIPALGTTGSCAACNHLVEQLPPTTAWGTLYYACDMAVKTGPDYLRLVSNNAGATNIMINSTAYTLTGVGSFTDVQLPNNSGVKITSDKPIYVIQECTGTACDNTPTDPMYINMIPEQQWGSYYPFATPAGVFNSATATNFVNIIKQGNTSSTAVDGVVIPASQFTQITTTGYYYAKYPVSASTIHVATGTSPFICYVYGFDQNDAYGYPAGGAFLHNISVPVELLTFDGEIKDQKAILKWATATEKNNAQFDIEKLDGSSYQALGTVKGHGNSFAKIEYNFTDLHPSEGVNYYRLKQIDFNGKYEYSKIIALNFSGKIISGIRLVPVPAKDHVTIQFDSKKNTDVIVRITNVLGGVLSSKELNNVSEGYNEQELDISQIAKGVYFLEIESAGEKSISKLVKE